MKKNAYKIKLIIVKYGGYHLVSSEVLLLPSLSTVTFTRYSPLVPLLLLIRNCERRHVGEVCEIFFNNQWDTILI